MHARDVYDFPPAGSRHGSGSLLAQKISAPEIDSDCNVPRIGTRFQKGLTKLDRRIINEDVEAAESLNGRRNESAVMRQIADVGLNRDGLAADRLDFTQQIG